MAPSISAAAAPGAEPFTYLLPLPLAYALNGRQSRSAGRTQTLSFAQARTKSTT